MKRTMTIISFMAAASMAAAAITTVSHTRDESAGQPCAAPRLEARVDANAIPDLLVVADSRGNTTAYTTEQGEGPLADVVVIAERALFCNQYAVVNRTGELRVWRIWHQGYSLDGISRLFDAHGFEIECARGDLTGQPLAEDSAVVGVVAVRKGRG